MLITPKHKTQLMTMEMSLILHAYWKYMMSTSLGNLEKSQWIKKMYSTDRRPHRSSSTCQGQWVWGIYRHTFLCTALSNKCNFPKFQVVNAMSTIVENLCLLFTFNLAYQSCNVKWWNAFNLPPECNFECALANTKAQQDRQPEKRSPVRRNYKNSKGIQSRVQVCTCLWSAGVKAGRLHKVMKTNIRIICLSNALHYAAVSHPISFHWL